MLICNSFQWRYNERDGISNRRPCLLSLLFKRRSNKISKLRVTGLCEGNLPVTWISRTKDQKRGKCFHLVTSSCETDMLSALEAKVIDAPSNECSPLYDWPLFDNQYLRRWIEPLDKSTLLIIPNHLSIFQKIMNSAIRFYSERDCLTIAANVCIALYMHCCDFQYIRTTTCIALTKILHKWFHRFIL